MRTPSRLMVWVTLLVAANVPGCSNSGKRTAAPASSTPATTSDPALQNAERQAREIASAMLRADYQRVTRSTFPRVVELNGGAARMTQIMRDGSAKMRADGV